MRAYRLKSPPPGEEGKLYFLFRGQDYDAAHDQTQILGRSCGAFTEKAFGGYPFVVLPWDDVEEADAPHLSSPRDDQVRSLCRVGQGSDCCRYLAVGPTGWSCEKLTPLAMHIDAREDMVARGDNCEGLAPRD